jgi:S-adenosylmethionine:tRNA ribosyltransferase-isomerase
VYRIKWNAEVTMQRNTMKLSDFDFILPPELISHVPSQKRDDSILLVAQPDKDLVQDRFYNIIDYVVPSDLIVFNDVKVIKAKLSLNTGTRKIDLYLNKQISDNYWHGFAKPSKKLKENDQFDFDNHSVVIRKKLGFGQVEVEFKLDNIQLFNFLEQYGEIPLPPYIKTAKNSVDNDQRYQTVYANKPGAVAAPTAGLHFTNELMEKVKAKGIEVAFITLHVGAGTFLPVKTEDIDQHKMHSEYCYIDNDTANVINNAKMAGRRIIAVGTTVVRTLESAATDGQIKPGGFETSIFIRPGFKFQIVDMLITNFHLPKSTLLMLVSAFAGYNKITEIYQYAIDHKMRFFSYGDATLLYRN